MQHDPEAPHQGHASWHDGEADAQARLGMRDRMAQIGPRVLHPNLPDEYRTFLAGLPFIVLGAVDETANIWASILFGAPGLITTPDDVTVRVAARPAAADALAPAVVPGRHLALLAINYLARQRIRVNGVVEAVSGAGFSLHVEQAFGNCRKYIPPRDWPAIGVRRGEAHAEILPHLNDAAWTLIESADTFFLATAASPNGAADVSHRGGPSGFLQRGAAGQILLPDYPGNFYFNSIGNLLCWPHAGLMFADWRRGDLLQITTTAEIVWEGPEVAAFPNAERLLRLTPLAGRWLRA